jgi:hypothetical protein
LLGNQFTKNGVQLDREFAGARLLL